MKNENTGFTLLEVLIALIIVSLVFFSCSLSLTQMTKNVHSLEEKTIGAIIASNIITQARLGMISAPKTGSLSGKIMMANSLWYWQLQSVHTDPFQVSEISVLVKNNHDNLVYQSKGFLSGRM